MSKSGSDTKTEGMNDCMNLQPSCQPGKPPSRGPRKKHQAITCAGAKSRSIKGGRNCCDRQLYVSQIETVSIYSFRNFTHHSRQAGVDTKFLTRLWSEVSRQHPIALMCSVKRVPSSLNQ